MTEPPGEDRMLALAVAHLAEILWLGEITGADAGGAGDAVPHRGLEHCRSNEEEM